MYRAQVSRGAVIVWRQSSAATVPPENATAAPRRAVIQARGQGRAVAPIVNGTTSASGGTARPRRGYGVQARGQGRASAPYSLGTTDPVATPRLAAGRSSKKQVRVEVDGEVFILDSEEAAIDLLMSVRAEAEKLADQVIERARNSTNRPKRKVLADARKSLVVPSIDVPSILKESAANTIAQIESLYNSAIQTVEIGAYLRKQAEMDEEDAILLLMLA